MENSTRNFVNWLAPKLAITFRAPECAMMTERADACFQNQGCVGASNCLIFFCGSFRDFPHESCIKGANHARGGVLKSTLVVDNDSVHTQHAFSPMVMTICSHSSTDARSAMAQEKDPQHIATHSRSISSFSFFLCFCFFVSVFCFFLCFSMFFLCFVQFFYVFLFFSVFLFFFLCFSLFFFVFVFLCFFVFP